MGVTNSFDFHRFLQNIRILAGNGQLQIGIHDKELFNIYQKVTEEMILQALSKVDTKIGISASINDMDSFMWMTDSIIYEILRSNDTDCSVQKAKASIGKLVNLRNRYKLSIVLEFLFGNIFLWYGVLEIVKVNGRK